MRVLSAATRARPCPRCRIQTRPILLTTMPSSRHLLSGQRAAAAAEEKQQQQQQQPRDAPISTPQTLYSFFPSTLPDGPPPKGPFPIDTRRLRTEFLGLQSRHHPDKHPARLKTQAEAASASINEAYKTLANPLLRAQYLLSLRGVDVAADETLKVEEPELLTVVLEAHEAMDDAASPADLEGLAAENEERIAASERLLGEAFRGENVDLAKREAVRLRYWVNIREALRDWEQAKGAVLQH